ncbi:hypothetical protein Bbelb_166750 [Branchiostoma belcheri]|nr:hypothetical protein Bbelb_166750 [Branchiostoma belcheri]
MTKAIVEHSEIPSSSGKQIVRWVVDGRISTSNRRYPVVGENNDRKRKSCFSADTFELQSRLELENDPPNIYLVKIGVEAAFTYQQGLSLQPEDFDHAEIGCLPDATRISCSL